MKPGSRSVFALAKAIMTTCETRSQLQDAVSFLKSPQNVDRLVRALEGLVDEDHSTRAKGANRDEEGPQTEKLLTLATKLRNEGFNARELELLVERVFGWHVPSAKLGLEKYIERLSRSPNFEQAYDHLMAAQLHKSTSEDPWLREMLTEQEKRDDEHE
jgi:hypothetical protein